MLRFQSEVNSRFYTSSCLGGKVDGFRSPTDARKKGYPGGCHSFDFTIRVGIILRPTMGGAC